MTVWRITYLISEIQDNVKEVNFELKEVKNEDKELKQEVREFGGEMEHELTEVKGTLQTQPSR